MTVTPEGFLWGDHTYTSLSAVAKAITGTNWNPGFQYDNQHGAADP